MLHCTKSTVILVTLATSHLLQEVGGTSLCADQAEAGGAEGYRPGAPPPASDIPLPRMGSHGFCVPRETQGFASSWYPLTWENLPLTAHKHGKRRPPDTTATSRNTKGLEKVPSFRRVPVPGLASALRPAEGRRNSVINTRGGKARVDPSSHPTRKLRGACRALSYGAASQKLLQPSAPERDPAWGMCAYGPT